MALAQAILVPEHIDTETGLPKAELRRMLDEGLDELKRGDGMSMDDAAWEKLREELRLRRQNRP